MTGNPEPAGFGELADRIAQAARDCSSVADLAAGPSGNAGTYLPGRIVRGVVLRDTEVEIHVVARYGPPLPEVAAQVQRAVAPLVPGGAVHVAIDDIVDDTVDDTATPEPSPRADPG